MKAICKVTLAAALVAAVCTAGHASPASTVFKGAVRGIEKVAEKGAVKGVAKGAAKGGAKLAAVTAEREAAKAAARHGTLKALAKEATAKKILAAGAATAMVTSAHEVSDGIQEASKNTGEGLKGAIENNPEIAVPIAKSFTAPVKWVVAACVVPIVGLLLWLLWPCVRLVRNAISLAAGRKAAKMGAGEVVDATAASTGRAGFTRVELFFVVAACLALTILGVWRMKSNGCSQPSESHVVESTTQNVQANAGNEERIAKRAAVVARLHAEYAASLKRHYSTFLCDVDQIGGAQFCAVRSRIPGVVGKFGTFSRCKELFTTIVTDRLKGGNATGDGIRRDLEADYYRGLYAARDRVYECLGSFLRNADAAKDAFKLELEAELDDVELPGDEVYKSLLEECGNRIEQKKSALNTAQIDAAISVAFEAVCIRQTVATVARILGKAAARQAGTMAAGAGAAVVDGPLPVGDIIGGVAVLGCTAWSVWDVYKATKVLPAELRATLESATADCERHTIAEVKKTGASIYEAYSAVARR